MPDIPLKLTLFPAHLALLIRLSRTRSIPATVVSLGLAGVCGKWALVQWMIVSLMAWTVTIMSESTTPSFSRLKASLDIEWTTRFRALATALMLHGPIIISAIFFAQSLFVRPAISLLFILAALVFALSSRVLPARSITVPLLGLALTMVALFPWSGALGATFPLPVPLWSLFLLAFVFFIARIGAAVLSVAMLLLVVVGYSLLAPALPQYPVEVTLEPGQTFNLPVEARTKTISVIISGSNIAALGRHSALARIEALDRRGGAYRRDVSIGDATDWGAYRRSMFFLTRNPVPSGSLNNVEGYGRSAFLHGAARMTMRLPAEAGMVRVTASPSLPSNATVQLMAIEYGCP